jgi:hypothetical protein
MRDTRNARKRADSFARGLAQFCTSPSVTMARRTPRHLDFVADRNRSKSSRPPHKGLANQWIPTSNIASSQCMRRISPKPLRRCCAREGNCGRAHDALLRDSIIAYAGPFSRNNGAAALKHRLGLTCVPAQFHNRHGEVIGLRDQLIAHSDFSRAEIPRHARFVAL